MKFRILLLSIVTSLTLVIPSNAVQPRVAYTMATLSFDGTTAYCSVSITGNTSSDKISAVITLWNGTTCLKTWGAQGTGYLVFSETTTVVRGQTYTLKVDATVGDKSMPTAYNTKKCP